MSPPLTPSLASGKHPPESSALRHFGAHLRFWTVVALGLAIDLWSKEWAFRTLRQGGRRVLIPYVLELQTMMNDGALFGIGSGRTTLFLIASGLALILVAWMFAQSSARSRLLHIALGGILAGALGNMYDRVCVKLVEQRPAGVPRYYVKSDSPDGRHIVLHEYPPRAEDKPLLCPRAAAADLPDEAGYVRDFIKIPTRIFGQRELWPWVFNAADMLLVGGVAILALRLWRDRRSPQDRASAKVDATAKST